MIYISLTSVFRPLTKNIVHTTCPVCAISAPIAGQTSKGTKHEKKITYDVLEKIYMKDNKIYHMHLLRNVAPSIVR